jgi:hypothetical protein
VSYQEFSIAVCRSASWAPTDKELAQAARFTAKDVGSPKALFVADPFLVGEPGNWHIFFELMPRGSRKGVIGVAHSEDASKWTYDRVVLEEQFHLSFPFVFRWDDQWLMIPESSEKGEVRLYRADSFPSGWRFERTLLTGRYSDSVVWESDGEWYMLTSPRMETACLFHAPEPIGPWTEHPSSPVVDGDLRSARPAGPMIASDRGWIRLAQDCEGTYGRAVSAFRVTCLSAENYVEERVSEEPVLGPGAESWRRRGMHQLHSIEVQSGGWICVCDGWRIRRRIAGLGILTGS